jgi:hypothetical protein
MGEFYKLPNQNSDDILNGTSEPTFSSYIGNEEESYNEKEKSFPIVDEDSDLTELSKEESGFVRHLAPYPSAEEERGLWKRYMKLRRIDEILGSETATVKTSEAGSIFFKIVEDICESVDLIK